MGDPDVIGAALFGAPEFHDLGDKRSVQFVMDRLAAGLLVAVADVFQHFRKPQIVVVIISCERVAASRTSMAYGPEWIDSTDFNLY
jgi:hypothetical protein